MPSLIMSIAEFYCWTENQQDSLILYNATISLWH
jgi:hypothetical protein